MCLMLSGDTSVPEVDWDDSGFQVKLSPNSTVFQILVRQIFAENFEIFYKNEPVDWVQVNHQHYVVYMDRVLEDNNTDVC